MNRDSDEIAKSASEEYTYSGYTSAVTLPPQREALTERDYRVLFEILPQGILCQDRAGRIVLANPAAQQMLGLSLDQLRGRTVFDKNWQLIREDGLPLPTQWSLPAGSLCRCHGHARSGYRHHRRRCPGVGRIGADGRPNAWETCRHLCGCERRRWRWCRRWRQPLVWRV